MSGKSASFGIWDRDLAGPVRGCETSRRDAGLVALHVRRELMQLPASGHVNSVSSVTLVVEGKPRRRRGPRMYKSDGPVRYCRRCRRIVALGHGC